MRKPKPPVGFAKNQKLAAAAAGQAETFKKLLF
jgi:hypothetical protein